jgi:hypothetical protein
MKSRCIFTSLLLALIVVSACTLPQAANITPPPIQDGNSQVQITATSVPALPATQTEPAPVPSETAGPALLTLDQNYFCNHGPGRNYTDILDFPARTVLPIIGSNGGGWWLVRIADPRTHHTECWIGGGVPSGDYHALPSPPPGGPFVPVHDESNWSNIIYLDCSELAHYHWIWNGASSGEYVATTPILGIARPTIVYDQWITVCPSWTPPPVVKIHDEATWTVVGYLTCTELEDYVWTWNGASSGEYYADRPIYGSSRPTVYLGEVSPVCPAFSP